MKSHYQESPLCICPNPDCREELGSEYEGMSYNTDTHRFVCDSCGWAQKHPCFMCAYNPGEKESLICRECSYKESK